MKIRCEYNRTLDPKQRCHKDARYKIGAASFFPTRITRLADVCGGHDRIVGRLNLIHAGWTLEGAIKSEKKPSLERC